MEVKLCQFEHGEDMVWDRYVRQTPSSSFCHLSAWKHVIEKAYGHKAWYFWVLENDRVVGILPLVSMETVLFGRSLVSLPFLDEGGICSDDTSATVKLYAAARQLGETMGIKTLELRHRYARPLSLPVHGNKVSLRLSLNATSTDKWKALNAKVRNQVRKAIKSGLRNRIFKRPF